MPFLVFLAPYSFSLGERWVYLGKPKDCEGCENNRLCHSNSKPGDVFNIIEDRKTKIFCKLRQDEITAVVGEKITLAALDCKIVGVKATLKYKSIKCESYNCPMLDICMIGVPTGSMIKVEEVIKNINCQNDNNKRISLVRIIELPSSTSNENV